MGMVFTNPLIAILFALILTILVELLIAYIIGYRKREILALIFALNLLTNPLLNYFILLNSQMKLIELSIQVIILLEIIVIITEFLLLSAVLKKEKTKLLILSILMNLASFLFGLLVAQI